MLVLANALALILAAQAVPPPAAPFAWSDPEVADHASILQAIPSTGEAAGELFGKLQLAAAGPPAEERSRDALFALARFLPEGEEAHEAMRTISAFYPEDPRTPWVLVRLGMAQLQANDPLSAHISWTRVLHDKPELGGAELLTRAALNAIEVGDAASAINWAGQVDAGLLPRELHPLLLLARLKAFASLGKHDEAAEAVGRLEELAPGFLKREPAALLSAARAEAAAGNSDSASRRYELFINLHTKSTDRPAAMLEYGRLLAGMGAVKPAEWTFDLLLEQYPDDPQADLVLLERIGLDRSLSFAERLDAYREVAETSASTLGASEACKLIHESGLRASRPLDAISLLGWMAREGEGFGSPAAWNLLSATPEPMIELLSSIDEDIELAAASAQLHSLGLPLPAEQEQRVLAARLKLGLAEQNSPTMEEILKAARADARAGRWKQALTSLEPLVNQPSDQSNSSLAELTHLLASALWWEERESDALDHLNKALELGLWAEEQRPLLVLRADILFAEGRTKEACADYRRASAMTATRWVSRQLRSCEPATEVAQEISR